MTVDIESIRQMILSCEGDGQRLDRYDHSQILFALSQLIKEVDRVWTLHPELADHTWRDFA
jgi:hypothetical protein